MALRFKETPTNAARQTLRIRTLRMSATSYVGVFGLVGFCWYQDAFPLRVVFEYGLMVLALLAAFYVLFRSNLNLRFPDPSLTLLQCCVAFLPTLWVIYWADDFSARAALLVISTLPALYGVLALDTRRLLFLAAFYATTYALLMTTLWLQKPQQINPSAEATVLLAFTMVMLQSATVGGFISGLRQALRQRNTKLQTTMGELNAALTELNVLASRDALTGAFNRRHLYAVLTEEVVRCERGRKQAPLSLCMLDIDHFKQVNDVHGHQAGDAILCKVAATTEQSLRCIDSCARFGGEEFLLVLPQTPLEGAHTVAERLRVEIAALKFPEVAADLKVTISVGVAQYVEGELIDATIARADAALYAAKHAGRNRVAMA
ncbi:hypothetical protein LCGC14_0410730 [marine sediment metagenome]|uniref:GGDEF domain-containing protein n=1 Tax=marine sediment metagenome TaxID=412755 RepID=A0A0F9TBZ2_9ZZZZ